MAKQGMSRTTNQRRAGSHRRPHQGARRAASTGASPIRAEGAGVFAILQEGHENVQSEYEGFQTAGGDDRYYLSNRILRELELHNLLEEEVFYPAVQKEVARRGHKKGAVLMRATLKEHREVKDHVARVKAGRSQDDRLTAQMDALMQRVQRHVQTEERDLFPLVHALLGEAGLARLRQDLCERQRELEPRLAA